MQSDELVKLVKILQRQKCESQTIEVKTANINCPERLYDSLSSFSNQNDGGIIIFGINEKENFKITGVYDPQDLQHKVNEQCKQMEPVVRALFTVCEIDNKIIVSAEIPGVDISERPVYYRGRGRLKGSYVRVGESDELMTEYEIYSYDAFRKRTRDDLRIVENSNLNLFAQEELNKYLYLVKENKKNFSNFSDEEILELMGITRGSIPTLSGVMVFSKYPQAYFPQLSITAVVVPGNEIGDTNENGARFIANQRIEGTIPEMLKDAIDFVRRNSRVKTIINSAGERKDEGEYPIIAVREAVLNSLLHRDYSIYTENIPIRIYMYNDRMEIINSGGLYGRLSIDELGKIKPETRNPTLANVLEVLKETENRYSGIPTIKKEMEKYKLPEPKFIVARGDFKVIFYNNLFKQEKNKLTIDDNLLNNNLSIEERVLEFCKIPRSREEITELVKFSRLYTMKKIVVPLLERKKLKMTIPDKPKSKNQKYVIN